MRRGHGRGGHHDPHDADPHDLPPLPPVDHDDDEDDADSGAASHGGMKVWQKLTALFAAVLILGGGACFLLSEEDEPVAHSRTTRRTAPRTEVLVDLGSCYTPECTVYVSGLVHRFETEPKNVPMRALPPGWNEEDAVYFVDNNGRSVTKLRGGNIHPGDWKFWVDGDKKRRVKILIKGRIAQ